MRTIESKRNKQTGDNYHYCPKTQGIEHIETCQECIKSAGQGEVENLTSTYRVHCPFGEEVKAVTPSHVEPCERIPPSWGTSDPYELKQYTIVEPKLDGARCLLKFNRDNIQAFSRRNTKFGDQSEFGANIPHITGKPLPELAGTIFDGELICQKGAVSATGNIPAGTLGATMAVVGSLAPAAVETQQQSGWAHLYVFDMPRWFNDDLTEMSWEIRHELLVNEINKLPEYLKKYVHIMPFNRVVDPEIKRGLYSKYLKDGAEGIVLKNPNMTYYGLRAGLKIKQDVTLDVQVMGYEMGSKGGKFEYTIGALIFGVIDAKTRTLREVGKVNPGSNETRDFLLKRLEGKTQDEIIEMKIIMWLRAQGWTKDYRLRHPAVLEYCQDRDKPTTVDFDSLSRI